MYKVEKKDKWWEELENMEDYIEEEVKRIVENREEEWKREKKVIFWKDMFKTQLSFENR